MGLKLVEMKVEVTYGTRNTGRNCDGNLSNAQNAPEQSFEAQLRWAARAFQHFSFSSLFLALPPLFSLPIFPRPSNGILSVLFTEIYYHNNGSSATAGEIKKKKGNKAKNHSQLVSDEMKTSGFQGEKGDHGPGKRNQMICGKTTHK